jgi:hypothetical protein
MIPSLVRAEVSDYKPVPHSARENIIFAVRAVWDPKLVIGCEKYDRTMSSDFIYLLRIVGEIKVNKRRAQPLYIFSIFTNSDYFGSHSMTDGLRRLDIALSTNKDYNAISKVSAALFVKKLLNKGDLLNPNAKYEFVLENKIEDCSIP